MRDDFKKAIGHMGAVAKFVFKKSLKEAESFLNPNEEVLNVESVNLDKGPGILVVTDKRVYFAFKIVASHEFIQLPYSEINTVSVEPIFRRMKIETNFRTLNISAVHKKRCKDIQRNILDRI